MNFLFKGPLLVALHVLLLFISSGVGSNPSQKRRKREVKNPTVLNKAEKRFVVLRHNEARSSVNPSCNSMMKMIWNEDLGITAQEYSRKCIYEHSHDITTREFDNIGENLFISTPEVAPKRILREAVRTWDGEKRLYNYTTNQCRDVCGHYTQLVWDTSYAVGCGITTCFDINVDGEIWPEGQLVVCHYGPTGNLNGRRPYRRGTPCTVCPRNYWCEYNLCAGTDDPSLDNSHCGSSFLHCNNNYLAIVFFGILFNLYLC